MMERRELMSNLTRIAKERSEEIEIREGGNHTVVSIGAARTTIPRHNEIDDMLVRKIMKQIGEGQ